MEAFKNNTDRSVRDTIIYDINTSDISSTKCASNIMNVYVDDIDSVSAIYKYGFNFYNAKMAVLNFASYKNPGGMFLKGSKAQEECLCHESNLYNILREFEETYYSYNRKNLNRALYTDRALYTPNVLFIRDNRKLPCDVITCAAPNWSAASRYNMATQKENIDALKSRIKFVLDIANDQRVDILILGAFGCGVFGQNPYTVADIFWGTLCMYRYNFKTIVFAIPGPKDDMNLSAFRHWFGKERGNNVYKTGESHITMMSEFGFVNKIK